MDYKRLVAICRHELRLVEDCDIARLIREVKMIQDDSSDTYTRLTKEHRIKAREILSGYMLTWEYVEGLDSPGYGQRFWKEKVSSPDALMWPKDKKKILAGVEKMFNDLQDYAIIDRQKRKSRPTPRTDKEADAEHDSPPPVAQSTIRPPTKQGRRRDEQLMTDFAPVPFHAALIVQDTELGEQASSQKKEPKKAASKESYNADSNTQLEIAVTDESAKESPSIKKALTPPYIPDKGLHQTWPAFGFKGVSKEGARALRTRTVKIGDSEEAPSKTTLMTPGGSKGSRAKANRKQTSAEKYFSIVPAERSEEGHIDNEGSERTRKGRFPSSPKSFWTRGQAASAKAINNCSPTLEDDAATSEVSLSAAPSSDGPAVQATAVQRSQRPQAKAVTSQ